jgi:DNA-binding MarR family transcriptional regulator
MNERTIRVEENLRRVCYKIKIKGREILNDVDITPPQFEALQFLIHEENMTIGELSTKMYLACSTVTDLLDRMERNDLVKRGSLTVSSIEKR